VFKVPLVLVADINTTVVLRCEMGVQANNMRKKRALNYENIISHKQNGSLCFHKTPGAAQTFTPLAHFSTSCGWCLGILLAELLLVKSK
jgi:hypothetical protein